MAILPIIIAPDPLLKTKSSPVTSVDDSIHKLAADMFDTMYHQEGIGLAAVQVGELKRILVADVEWKKGEIGKQYVLINPEIIDDKSEMNLYKEGCLSFPEQFAEVERPKNIRVRYMDLNGDTKEESFDGLLATCIQHEIDHINGITFVDHISKLKREMIHKKLTKMKKAGYFEHEHHDHVHGEHCNHG